MRKDRPAVSIAKRLACRWVKSPTRPMFRRAQSMKVRVVSSSHTTPAPTVLKLPRLRFRKVIRRLSNAPRSSGGPPAHGDHRVRIRIIQLAGLGPRPQRRVARIRPMRRTTARGAGRLPGESLDDPTRLSRPQRKDEMTGAEVGAANVVDEAKSGRRRPADIRRRISSISGSPGSRRRKEGPGRRTIAR